MENKILSVVCVGDGEYGVCFILESANYNHENG